MEEIKNWAFSVCCCAIVCGILNLILPEGSIKKIFKSVLCVFFLSVVINPLSAMEYPDFLSLKNKDFGIAPDYEENAFNGISEEYLENEIIKSTEEILKSLDINFEDISIKVNIREDQSIDINDFAVVVSEKGNTDELAEKILQKTGIEPKIILSGENQNG